MIGIEKDSRTLRSWSVNTFDYHKKRKGADNGWTYDADYRVGLLFAIPYTNKTNNTQGI